jgi:uncharacterized repeat protein (TIGR03803 family)
VKANIPKIKQRMMQGPLTFNPAISATRCSFISTVLILILGTAVIPSNAVAQIMSGSDTQISVIPASGLGSMNATWTPFTDQTFELANVNVDPNVWNVNTNSNANVQGSIGMNYTSGSGTALTTTISLTSSGSMALPTTAVVGYPEIEYGGCDPFTSSDQPQSSALQLPMNILALPAKLWLLTDYAVTDGQNSANWDFAYDIWILKNAPNCPGHFPTNTDWEVMIWLGNSSGLPPPTTALPANLSGSFTTLAWISGQYVEQTWNWLAQEHTNHFNTIWIWMPNGGSSSSYAGVDFKEMLSQAFTALNINDPQDFWLYQIDLGSEFSAVTPLLSNPEADYSWSISDYYFVVNPVTNSFPLPSDISWFDTGIALTNGEAITIAANGTINVGALLNPNYDVETPAGQPGVTPGAGGATLAPNLPAWSLIGMLGPNGTPFEVGTGTNFAVSTGGELYLSVNDNYFGDNSGAWNVSIVVLTPPTIIEQPQSQMVAVGGTASFTVSNTGMSPFSYQWFWNDPSHPLHDGGNVNGSLSNTLTISNVQTNNAGVYYVAVSNSVASVTSDKAFLTISAIGVQTLYAFPYTVGLEVPSKPVIIQGSDGNLYGTTSGYNTNGGASQYGCVFKITPAGNFANLYILNTNTTVTGGGLISSNNGVFPSALAQGNDGSLYGTTSFGGPLTIILSSPVTEIGAWGTLFKITTSGALTTLYPFSSSYVYSGNTNGTSPNGLIKGNNGHLYGTTEKGIPWPGFGTVFQTTTNGNVTTLYSFGGYDGSDPNGLILGNDGYLYGVTEYGGPDYDGSDSSSGEGTVFGIDPTTGDFWTVYPFSGSDGETPNTLIQGNNGNLYGTTESSTPTVGPPASGGGGTIFAITPSGFDNLYTFDFFNATNGLWPNTLIQGLDGNLYGTTVYGGFFPSTNSSGLGTVFELDTNGIFTTLYMFKGGSDGAYPCALIQGSDGSLYGMTCGASNNATIFRIGTNAIAGSPPVITQEPQGLTVMPGSNVTFTVTAIGAPLLNYQWLKNGTNVANTGSISGATTTTLTISDAQTNNNGNYTVVVNNSFDSVTSSPPAILIVDGQKPTNQIVLPTSGLLVSNAVYTVTGKAGDNVAVADVFYQLDVGGWNPATSTNNWTNWSSQVNLTPGTNIVQAYAADTAGNLSTTNTVSFDYVVSALLTVQLTGKGTITPNYSNAVLQVGVAYSMTAVVVAGSGFAFTNWTGGTSLPLTVLTNGTTVKFVMESNLTLQANFVDTNKPVLAITSPTSGQRWSNAVFTATGTATDNVAVADVFCSLNSAGWSNALTANNWSNWTASVTLLPGTNTIAAYAVDTSGNLSTTNTVSFQFVLTNQLGVRAIGLGTISPSYSNAWLEIGRNYSITSSPASGFVFTNWTVSTNWIGGAVATGTNLQFMMESNLTLQASFVETNKPTLTITAPIAGQHMTNALATVTGTASDKWGVTGVWYQLNNNEAWNASATTNGWTNWTTTVELISGTNTVKAYALNLGGNFSTTNNVSMVSSNTFMLQLTFTNALPLTTTGLIFSLQLSSGLNGHIQVSTNLLTWTTLTNFVGTNSTISFRDPAATNFSRRFYQAVIP